MDLIAGGFVGGCVLGGLIGLLWRELATLTRQITQLERKAARRRELRR